MVERGLGEERGREDLGLMQTNSSQRHGLRLEKE